MSEKFKHKIDASVVICALLFVVLLALCVVGVIFGMCGGVPVVAFADSTNGVVEDNLLPLSYLTNGTYSSDVVLNDYFRLWMGSNSSLVITDNSSVQFRSTSLSDSWNVLQYTGTLQPGTYTMSAYISSFTNGTFLMNVGNGSVGTSPSFSSIGVCTFTFTLSSPLSDFRWYANNSNLIISWIKIEKGSSFTGYVPKNYLNYGYNQGYNEGLNSYDSSRYNLLDSFNKDAFSTANGSFYTQFTYDGRDYDTGVTASWTTVNSSSYSMCRLVPAQTGKYVGIKYVNNLLFGDIVLQFAMSTNPNFPAVFHFVDTVTGDTLIVSSGDTVHFKYIR